MQTGKWCSTPSAIRLPEWAASLAVCNTIIFEFEIAAADRELVGIALGNRAGGAGDFAFDDAKAMDQLLVGGALAALFARIDFSA